MRGDEIVAELYKIAPSEFKQLIDASLDSANNSGNKRPPPRVSQF